MTTATPHHPPTLNAYPAYPGAGSPPLRVPPAPPGVFRAPRRPAVGYLCRPDSDDDLINVLHQQLAHHAMGTGLDLVEVYVDRDTPSDADRPALALAIDAIALRPDALLLIPDLTHLPTVHGVGTAFADRFTTITAEIHAVNATLALVTPPQPGDPAGVETAGLTPDDLADELRAALADIPLDRTDEQVLAWLATQTTTRALAIASLLRRARTRA